MENKKEIIKIESKSENRKLFISILIPFLIICFWPFPSKWIGYSVALYISDAVLMFFLLIWGIKNKYRLENTAVNKFLIAFIFLNVLATILAIVRTNYWEIRQFTEIVRMIEWFIMYHYLYQTLKQLKSSNM